MPRIDVDALPWKSGTGYPAPYDEAVRGRERKKLGVQVGLDQFGVNLSRLAPGMASAQRHWHEREDEFVYVLEGELTLIEDGGETVLHAGDAAGFKAGVANGHHLVNRSDRPAVFLEIGSRSPDETAHYPDIDLHMERRANDARFLHKNGTPYD